MHAELKAQVAFHLTGKRPAAGLEAVEQLHLRPAHLARYRDLTRLRYDFPVILAQSGGEAPAVHSLTALVNAALQEVAPQGVEGEQMRSHVLELEREIRTLAADGTTGSLSVFWEVAASRLGGSDPAMARNLERARAAIAVDGELVDCNPAMPAQLFQHVWHEREQRKAAAFRKTVNRLIQKLSDILRADQVNSDAGLEPDTLKSNVGSTHAEIFDFAAMSRLLGKGVPRHPLPANRRERIGWALATLKAQRFYDTPERHALHNHAGKAHNFLFESCAGALKAWRDRLPELAEMAKAMALAELEIDGRYVESQHDAFFRDYGESMLSASDVAVFPDYLVRMNADHLPPADHERMNEILGSWLPIKILLQHDDLLDASPLIGARPAFGMRNLQFARAAMQFDDAYVVQAPASHLHAFRDRIAGGMAYAGPALFSVYTGAEGASAKMPAFLTAAAAMECRAFPAYVYDPSAGATLAARFTLDDNPAAERDWPVHALRYEDEAHQRVAVELPFTFLDFVAADPRYAVHFARVPQKQWSERMVPAADVLDGRAGAVNAIPCLLVVDGNDGLHKVIVDDKLLKEARRCRDAWHSLQELGGVHNSHAERLLVREKAAWQEALARDAAARAAAVPAPVAAPPAAPAATAPATEAVAEEQKSDDPYIETVRCSSCNECIQLNSRMFAYDDNKRAYIADVNAGTYRELVEAAENCQVSVIHPGKPRNANEPGLDELLKRAEPFL
jgi:hypothetical protein